MTTFAIVFALGVATIFVALAVVHNTSLGGTRSDYNDGSSVLFSIGGAAVLIGLVGFFVKWIFP